MRSASTRDHCCVSGTPPRFFLRRSGRVCVPWLDPFWARLELQLAVGTRRGFDTVNRSPDTVLDKLTLHLCGGDLLLLHDCHADADRSGQPVISEVLPRLLEGF